MIKSDKNEQILVNTYNDDDHILTQSIVSKATSGLPQSKNFTLNTEDKEIQINKYTIVLF